MVAGTQGTRRAKQAAVDERLSALRALMRERGIDAVLVRATDEFLNEYVPTDESTRAWVTGFTGSMGDALVTGDRAILVVDGRYALQASSEAPGFQASVIPLGTSIEQGVLGKLEELSAQGVRRLGVETERVPASTFESLRARALAVSIEVVPTVPSLVALARERLEGFRPKKGGAVWPVAKSLAGRSVEDRLALVRPFFAEKKIDGLLVVPLDEIAWITNLRGEQFPFQATFRARAIVLPGEVVLAADAAALKDGARAEPEVRFCGEGKLPEAVDALKESNPGLRLGFDPAHTPEALRASLVERGASLVPVESPFSKLRAKKTEAELSHMAEAFRRADQVVSRLQSWLSSSVSRGERVTEAMVARKVEALFKKSGAFGLSFKVISAAGKHGAIIHYSTPDDETPIREGEIFLLDTGAYYEGGYATDLTRTFLVGKAHVKATAEQKRLYTLVLQGAIAGMSARVPRGSTGEQLDALVRDPLWRAGLDYGHGTGHGVGVNVHEFPPRIAPGVRAVVEEGHVFSIEPGVYLPDFGGVRIENLCTCVADPENPRFLRIKPLTFSPLDLRLVERSMLTAHEKRFLSWFQQRAKRPSALDDELPPVR